MIPFSHGVDIKSFLDFWITFLIDKGLDRVILLAYLSGYDHSVRNSLKKLKQNSIPLYIHRK